MRKLETPVPPHNPASQRIIRGILILSNLRQQPLKYLVKSIPKGVGVTNGIREGMIEVKLNQIFGLGCRFNFVKYEVKCTLNPGA